MTKIKTFAAALIGASLIAGMALADGDATAGAKVFKKCKACHQVGDKAKNRIGPELNGIVGRLAGSADGFTRYSKAMKAKNAEGMIWDEANLDTWLTKPKAFIPKTKMSFAGLKKADDRANLIAYLATFK